MGSETNVLFDSYPRFDDGPGISRATCLSALKCYACTVVYGLYMYIYT